MGGKNIHVHHYTCMYICVSLCNIVEDNITVLKYISEHSNNVLCTSAPCTCTCMWHIHNYYTCVYNVYTGMCMYIQ